MSTIAAELARLAAERARGAWDAAMAMGAGGVPARAIAAEAASACAETLLELPGAEVRTIAGAEVFVVERDVEALYPEGRVAETMAEGLARWTAEAESAGGGVGAGGGARTAAAPRRLADIAVLDLETAGLWGCPLFVTAFLFEEAGRLVTLQLMTRTYAEEEAVVRASAEILRGRTHLVTFNGKSFDLPFLAGRATLHRVPFDDAAAMPHLDLLHPARRLYRGHFPDCRLQTLERMLLGIRRVGDIASAEIPAVFHHFVATGEIERVKDVLHHSRIDVISTGMLLGRMGG